MSARKGETLSPSELPFYQDGRCPDCGVRFVSTTKNCIGPKCGSEFRSEIRLGVVRSTDARPNQNKLYGEKPKPVPQPRLWISDLTLNSQICVLARTHQEAKDVVFANAERVEVWQNLTRIDMTMGVVRAIERGQSIPDRYLNCTPYMDKQLEISLDFPELNWTCREWGHK